MAATTSSFAPPFMFPRIRSSAKIKRGGSSSFLDTLEEQVRRYPTNSNDYFFWQEAGGLVA